MTGHKLRIKILLALMLLLIGQAAYAQEETQTAILQIEGMV